MTSRCKLYIWFCVCLFGLTSGMETKQGKKMEKETNRLYTLVNQHTPRCHHHHAHHHRYPEGK